MTAWKNKTTVALILFTGYALFSAWVYTGGTEQHIPYVFTEAEKKGKELWLQHNCQSCHQLYGLGGYLGPDLTRVISDEKRGKAYAMAFLQNGGTRMPNYHFTETEITALIAYLSYVDATAQNQSGR